MKIGAKVKVTHNPAHDVKFYEEAQAARKANDGRVGTVMHLRGTLECPAFAVDTGSGVLACYEADELASVPEYQPSEQVRAITRAAEGLDRVVTVARENAALWRADVDALQAAIQGLTGKGGTVASMVGDLADIARDMAALKSAIEARDVLDARLQVSARVASALRTILRDGDAMAVLRCLDDLDKALRGMPLGETRGRQGERFHRPAIDLRPEDLPGFVASLDQHVLGLEQRVIALEYGREYAATSEGKS